MTPNVLCFEENSQSVFAEALAKHINNDHRMESEAFVFICLVSTICEKEANSFLENLPCTGTCGWDSTIIASNHTLHAANKKLRGQERLNQQLWRSTPHPLLSLLMRIESETKKTLNFTRVGLIWKSPGGRLFTHRLSRLGAR